MSYEAVKQAWEASFEEQKSRQAYNTSPVEALARNVSYYLRARYSEDQMHTLHFCELGCGAGPNLLWLAQKGIAVSGVDISPTALALAKDAFAQSQFADRLADLVEGSVTQTPFADASFDGIVEACVFQHLTRDDRYAAFKEVKRLLKPGGVFVGYMLDRGHTLYQEKHAEALKEDPGTILMNEGRSNIYLSNLGVCHFYDKAEFGELLSGFSVVDPCLTTYYLPREEAQRRGRETYLQSMWTVYAVK